MSLISSSALTFWNSAHLFIEAGVALGGVAEIYCHVIPDRWLPAKSRSLEARAVIGKRGAIILAVALVLGVPTEIIRDKINDERMADLADAVSPPRLNVDQKADFLSVLITDKPHTIFIISPMNDLQSNDFADDFMEPFKEANWDVQRMRNWARPKYGVVLAKVGNEVLPGEYTLGSALNAAHVKYHSEQITGDDIRAISPSFVSGDLYLLIGPKPR